MKKKDKFSAIILGINKNVIRVLIGLMSLTLILSSLHLMTLEYQKIQEHPFLLVDVTTLFEVFNYILIIAIGYELIRSLLLIISSDTFPTLPIIQIALIAVSNKIITLDTKQTDSYTLIGLALLIAALAIAHFLLKYEKVAKTDSTTDNRE